MPPTDSDSTATDAASQADAPSGERPNVVFILADDLGWGDVGYHGSPIRTPNLDRLARGGVELDQHYVCPVCTPTRVSLMTGRHPGRFGRHATTPTNLPVMADGYWTMARMFQDAGYATGLFGKWHLGSDSAFFPGKYGFDTSYGSMAGGVDPYSHRYKMGEHSYTWHRNGKRLDERGHVTDLIVNEATSWLQEQKGPFFCYLPFTAVHTPVRAPEEWLDRYWGETYDADPERDRSFKTYAAYTSHLDHAVGRVIETLKEMDAIHNTLIVFTSDNGAVTTNPGNDTAKYPGYHEDMPRTGCNAPLRGHKAQLFDGGIRTPSIASWASRLAARRVSTPIQMTDWMPTFAALVGAPIPAGLDPAWDGENIWPLLEGEADPAPDRAMFWNLRHEWFAVRQHGWKLIEKRPRRSHADPSPAPTLELFHIDEDPLELKECSAEHPYRVAALRTLIAEQHALDDAALRPDMAAQQ